jgi:hypothetical protein
VDVVEMESGDLRIVVAPTRGMAILEAHVGDVRLGWDSPVTQVVHPQWIDLESRGGLGWLEGFGEWMARCWLEWAGLPGRDRVVTNTGAVVEQDLSLHGRIGNLPASRLVLRVDRRPPFRVTLAGMVEERAMFGPKLVLDAEISFVPGENSFRLDDTVTNAGGTAQEMQNLYHANFGPPLCGKGSRFVAPVARVTPMNAEAAKGVGDWAIYGPPTKGWIERVYLIAPLGDARGRVTAMLRNQKGDRGVSMRWPLAQLPHLTLWKNTAAAADGYVTGIEPGTCLPHNRRIEREAGSVVVLEPGRRRRFVIDVDVLRDAAAVARVEQNIAKVQAGTKPRIDEKAARPR